MELTREDLLQSFLRLARTEHAACLKHGGDLVAGEKRDDLACTGCWRNIPFEPFLQVILREHQFSLSNQPTG